MLKTQGRTWDGVPLPKLSVTDLKQDAIQLFKEKAVKRGRLTNEEVSVEDTILMDKLHLINEDGYLIRAAMLAFYKDPEKWVTGSYIKIGYFGKSDSDLVYQDEVHGPLIEQIDKTVDRFGEVTVARDHLHPRIPDAGIVKGRNRTAKVGMELQLFGGGKHFCIQLLGSPTGDIHVTIGDFFHDFGLGKLGFPFHPDHFPQAFRQGDVFRGEKGIKHLVSRQIDERLHKKALLLDIFEFLF